MPQAGNLASDLVKPPRRLAVRNRRRLHRWVLLLPRLWTSKHSFEYVKFCNIRLGDPFASREHGITSDLHTVTLSLLHNINECQSWHFCTISTNTILTNPCHHEVLLRHGERKHDLLKLISLCSLLHNYVMFHSSCKALPKEYAWVNGIQMLCCIPHGI